MEDQKEKGLPTHSAAKNVAKDPKLRVAAAEITTNQAVAVAHICRVGATVVSKSVTTTSQNAPVIIPVWRENHCQTLVVTAFSLVAVVVRVKIEKAQTQKAASVAASFSSRRTQSRATVWLFKPTARRAELPWAMVRVAVARVVP